MDREIDILERSLVWEWGAAIATVVVVAVLTWILAHWAGRRLKGSTRLGLRNVEKVAAPLALLAAGLAARRIIAGTDRDPPIVEVAVNGLLVVAAFWLAARSLDVLWATGRSSARLRHQAGARSMLLAGRQLGKAALVLGLIAVFSIRLGVGEQLYLALGAVGAALTFAARAPIANAMAFVQMMLAPPYHIGDRVRIEDFRGGAAIQGRVVAITLAATIVRSRSRSEVVIANSEIDRLRVENLSAADRRRLEMRLPIADSIPAETIRAACETIEADLRENRWVSAYREPHVWLSGYREGLALKASVWLQKGSDRRMAQRDLYALISARFEELTAGRSRGR